MSLARLLPGNRVVSKIKGNTYRLIVRMISTPALSSSASSARTPTTTRSTPRPSKPRTTTKAKVLKTERDYKAALAYVERLIDRHSRDEDELELWSLLVENYEETHFSITAPDPIEAIRFRLD